MSPELFDPEKFGFKDCRPTKHSDRYAFGIVIYEVLSGKTPFSKDHDYHVVAKVIKGERPVRPRGAEGGWFTDDVWDIVEGCWKPIPGDRPKIKDILHCLNQVPRSRASILHQVVPGPPATNASPRTPDSSSEDGTDGSEVPYPSQVVSSQLSERPSLGGNPEWVSRVSLVNGA
jgi:serine/threonine protein kinase